MPRNHATADELTAIAFASCKRRIPLDRYFAKALDQAEDHPIYALLHAVRSGVLRMTTQAYEHDLRITVRSCHFGLNESTVRCEPDANFRILADLVDRAKQTDEADVREILTDTHEKLAALLTAPDYGTTHGFLRTVRYLVGKEMYAAHATVGPLALQKRRHVPVLGSFREIIDTVRGVKLTDTDNGPALWNDPTIAQGRQAFHNHAVALTGADSCAVTLLMMLECAGYATHSDALRKDWGISKDVALILLKHRRIPVRHVEPIVRALLQREQVDSTAAQHLLSVWKHGEGEDAHQPTFRERMSAGLKKQHLDTGDLARYFRIRELCPGVRPTQPICNALSHSSVVYAAPFVAFPFFAETDLDGIRDAIALKREEFTAALNRRWTGEPEHVTVERRLCGVRKEEVEEDQEQYKDCEREMQSTHLREHDVLKRIRETGMEKVRSALAVCFAEKTGREPSEQDATLEYLTRWLLQQRGNKQIQMPNNLPEYVLGPLPTKVEMKAVAQGQSAMLPVQEKPLQDLLKRIAVVRERRIQEEDIQAQEARNAIEIRSKECPAHSVRELLQIMSHGSGKMSTLHERIPAEDPISGRAYRLACATMTKIVHGKPLCHYPSLPELEHLAGSQGYTISHEIRQDWSEKCARSLKRSGNTPFVRIVRTMIEEIATNLTSFCSESIGITIKKLKRLLVALRRGEPIRPEKLEPLFIELGVEQGKPRWVFLCCLQKAYAEGCQQEELIPKAYRMWQQKRGNEQWPEDWRSLPGVLPEEMGKLQSEKGIPHRGKRNTTKGEPGRGAAAGLR